jgi:hypothetical protein
MTTINRRLGTALGALLVAAAPAHAQTVSDVLTFLVTNQSVATGSIDRDREAALATSDTISRALLANLATLPVTAFVRRVRLPAESSARHGGARHAKLRTVLRRAFADGRPPPGIVRHDLSAPALHLARRPQPSATARW